MQESERRSALKNQVPPHCDPPTSALPGFIIEMNPIDSGSFVSHQALQPTEPDVPKWIMDMPLLRSFMVCLVMCL